MSLSGPHSKSKADQELTSISDSCCSAGCSSGESEGGIADPELARVVELWPNLSEPIRAAILALVKTAER